MHVICLEEVLGIDSRLLEQGNLLHVLGILKLQLRDEILEIGNLRPSLLRLQLCHQILKFIDSLH